MKNAQDYFNELHLNFKEEVIKLSKTMGIDGAIYFLIGEQTTFPIDADEELNEEFLDIIIEKYPELEF